MGKAGGTLFGRFRTSVQVLFSGFPSLVHGLRIQLAVSQVEKVPVFLAFVAAVESAKGQVIRHYSEDLGNGTVPTRYLC